MAPPYAKACPTCGQLLLEPRGTVTTSQAAAVLEVSPATMRTWCDRGLVPYTLTVGGHRRIRRQDLEALRRHREAS